MTNSRAEVIDEILALLWERVNDCDEIRASYAGNGEPQLAYPWKIRAFETRDMAKEIQERFL